jgi:hypothetical protein
MRPVVNLGRLNGLQDFAKNFPFRGVMASDNLFPRFVQALPELVVHSRQTERIRHVFLEALTGPGCLSPQTLEVVCTIKVAASKQRANRGRRGQSRLNHESGWNWRGGRTSPSTLRCIER